MDTLEMMQVYCRIIETGSFSRVAEHMNLSRAVVSKYVRALEDRLGARLLNRTTRAISATEAGRIYYQHSIDILNQINSLETELSSLQKNVKGHLRVAAPTTFGEMYIAPHLHEFLEQYPEISIDLRLDDRIVSLVDEHIDVAIRIGQPKDSTLVAKPLGTMGIRLCASPLYIERYGKPESLADLQRHRLIYDTNEPGGDWTFVNSRGIVQSFPVNSRLKINSARAVREMLLRGEGIAMSPSFSVDDCLRQGDLIQLLPELTCVKIPVNALYVSTRYLPEKTKLFSQFIMGLVEAL